MSTNWQIYTFIYTLAWEPSAAKITKSYSRRLPALERFYLYTKCSLLNQLSILKPSLEHFHGSSEFPNKI